MLDFAMAKNTMKLIFGESRPIDSNKTKAGREKNRRVDLRIIEQD